ncbi:hypothetical protein [Thalassovita sp.]|uniref:hypothetical protein n=1 Tax=Thalassovita sp. TaxID=1979401 RepID=UPI0029DE738B|nr:hypothetical protein [Thalassovita sp.]
MADRDERGRFLTGSEAGPGRRSSYDPKMDEQAYKLALLGLNDEEIARFFSVSRNTLHRWKSENLGFRDAVQRGKEIADSEVACALYKRATGMLVKSEKITKGQEGETVISQTVTEIPPDTKAAMHWLQLRKRKTWGTKPHCDDQIHIRCTPAGSDTNAIRSMSDDELQEEIEAWLMRRRIEHEM